MKWEYEKLNDNSERWVLDHDFSSVIIDRKIDKNEFTLEVNKLSDYIITLNSKTIEEAKKTSHKIIAQLISEKINQLSSFMISISE